MLTHIIDKEMSALKKQIGNNIEIFHQTHNDYQILKNKLVALYPCGFIMLKNGYSLPFIGVTGGIRWIKNSNKETIYSNELIRYQKTDYNLSNSEDENFIEKMRIDKFGQEYRKKEAGWLFH